MAVGLLGIALILVMVMKGGARGDVLVAREEEGHDCSRD